MTIIQKNCGPIREDIRKLKGFGKIVAIASFSHVRGLIGSLTLLLWEDLVKL
jgi:hypothetical protein